MENANIDDWALQGWGIPILYVLLMYIIGLFPVTVFFTKVNVNQREQKIIFFNKFSWIKKNKRIMLEFDNITEFLYILNLVEKRKRIVEINYD